MLPQEASSEKKVTISFEEGLAQLEAIVSRLETGQVSLEESVKFYEEGVRLQRLCSRMLDEARLRIKKLEVTPDGQVSGSSDTDFSASVVGDTL